jgi:hypothetical protein
VRYWDDFTSGGNGSKVLANQDGAVAGGGDKGGAAAANGTAGAAPGNGTAGAAPGSSADAAAANGTTPAAAAGGAAAPAPGGDAPKVGKGSIQQFHRDDEQMEGAHVAERPRRRMKHARFMDEAEREAAREGPE